MCSSDLFWRNACSVCSFQAGFTSALSRRYSTNRPLLRVSVVRKLAMKTFLRRKWQSVCRMEMVDGLIVSLSDIPAGSNASFDESTSSLHGSWDTKAVCEIRSNGSCSHVSYEHSRKQETYKPKNIRCHVCCLTSGSLRWPGEPVLHRTGHPRLDTCPPL